MNDDTEVCDICNGSGHGELDYTSIDDKIEYYRVCKKCNGDGTINWLEKIFGKKSNNIVFIVKYQDFEGREVKENVSM